MYIEQITLENIKSYGSKPAIIKFGSGVNLIAGMNGAGKSTILEAIGFVLFDSLPYNQKDFIRRGKSGKSRILVRIRSSYDNRIYDIERTVPTNFAIYDVEENFKLSPESKDEILEWVKQHLQVEQTTDLAALFENAVGMQQGTITGVFLANASSRKSTFDALLRVEDYDDAWTNLRDTENYIKELTIDNNQKLAVAENTIDTLQNKPYEAENLGEDIAQAEQQLITIKTDIARLDIEQGAMDELSKKIEEKERIQTDLKKAESDYNKQEENITNLFPKVEERVQLNYQVDVLQRERDEIDENVQRHKKKREKLAKIVEDAEVTFKKTEKQWKEFQDINKELDRLDAEYKKSIERQSEIEDDLSRREELNTLLEETEQSLSKAQSQKTQSEALLKANSEKQQELLQMRELLGEKGAKCPVCQQEMDGRAHTEAIQYYDDEEHKVRTQNESAESERNIAIKVITSHKKSKAHYEDELKTLANDKALQNIQDQINDYEQQIENRKSALEQISDIEQVHQSAEDDLTSAKESLKMHDNEAEKLGQERTELIDKISDLNKQVADLPSQQQLDSEQKRLDELENTIKEKAQVLTELENLPDYNAEAHNKIKEAYQQAIQEQAKFETTIELNKENLRKVKDDVLKLKAANEKVVELQARAAMLDKHQAVFSFVRKTVRDAGPRIRERKVRLVSEVASNYFNEIISDYTMRLQWNTDDYGIVIEQSGEERPFQVLSGGEQMIAALSVRLALLTHLTRIRLIFLDEPTINLDDNRRVMLSSQLSKIRDLQQLFVISHDDTFIEESDHVIEVKKVDDVSVVEVG